MPVRPAITTEELDACYAIRMEVFVTEQQVPLEEEIDAYDPIARHFLLDIDGAPAGTARLVEYREGTGKIGRVAVRKEYRGRGGGSALMRQLMDEGFGAYDTLILDAQVPVIAFYERLGFAAEGSVFLDAGIPHRRMTAHRPSRSQTTSAREVAAG